MIMPTAREIATTLMAVENGQLTAEPTYKSFRQLLVEHPDLRPPVIHGLLRYGETMNVIAPQKLGKSWLVGDLALALATGRAWLNTYMTERVDVLILDNELHGETLANRIPRIAEVRGIGLDEYADHVFVDVLRGRLVDLYALDGYFARVRPGQFKLVILDALYRFWPKEVDENDNGSVANCYNCLDSIAGRLGCSFVLIHHATKGNQSAKAVTDVGSGAGAQSRATDSHLILRHHEEPGAVVLDAAVRSWPPIQPTCLRWSFPVWTPAPDLDPAALRPDRPRRPAKPKAQQEPAAPIIADEVPDFVAHYLTDNPQTAAAIVDAAIVDRVPQTRAKSLLKRAEARGLVHRWEFGRSKPIQFATAPQPAMPLDDGVCARARTPRTPRMSQKRLRGRVKKHTRAQTGGAS